MSTVFDSFCLENVGQLTLRIINYHSLVVLFVRALHASHMIFLRTHQPDVVRNASFLFNPDIFWKITPGDSYYLPGRSEDIEATNRRVIINQSEQAEPESTQ
jgi:hypothetical protein